MAKWIFTREGSWSYPSLGFVATTGDVLEADLAPDAFWDETDPGAIVTIPATPDGGVVEPADGSVLVYRRSTNLQQWEELTAGVVGAVPNTPEGRQALAESSEISATFVRFVDHITGEPIDPAGTVLIKVNTTTGEIDDITFEEV